MGYSGAGGKLIHKKNQKQKISWHCPFKMKFSQQYIADMHAIRGYRRQKGNRLRFAIASKVI